MNDQRTWRQAVRAATATASRGTLTVQWHRAETWTHADVRAVEAVEMSVRENPIAGVIFQAVEAQR